MNDLRGLYQEVIVDHNRNPRNFHKLKTANASAEGFNPFCGDRVTLYLYLEEDVIKDISFEGTGCAISMASASLMTEYLKGKTLEEAKMIFECFHHIVTQDSPTELALSKVGKLSVLSGVQAFPARVKCATLVWHTFKAALACESSSVSTE